MAIAKATAFLKDAVKLNELAKVELLTADLEANQVKFVGADTVKLPVINYSYIDTGDDDKVKPLNTLSTYSRTTGFVNASLNLNWDTFKLTQDMGNSLKLDAMDDEEGLSAAITPYVEQYIRAVEVPAIDTYRLAKLAVEAGVFARNEAITDGDELYLALLDAFAALKNAEFSEEGLLLYVSGGTDALLQNNAFLKNFIRVDEFVNGGIRTKVRYFNNAKIIVVPSGRWPKKFGTYGTNVTINFILVHPTAQIATIKHRPAHFYPEGTVAGFDGSQVDMRIYHDLFVLPARELGVYVSVDDKVWEVKFDSDGGTAVPRQFVANSGKAATPDPAPTKTGFTFDGWYTKIDGGGDAWTFGSDTVTKDITLYAKWEE